MENPLNWLAVSGVLIFILVLVMIQGYGVMRVGWWNLSRLRELKHRQLATGDPLEAKALASVIECCEELRKKWVLGEPDLHVFSKTRDLVQEIAGHFHPKSKAPLQEARLGALLNAFLQLKIQVEALAAMRGVRRITQFRLRHIVFFSSAWRKKTEWQESKVGRALSRLKVYFIFKWTAYVWRCLDLIFWSMKMFQYFLYDIVFKVFLIRWYLLVGKLALQVYRDRDGKEEQPPEDVLPDLERLDDPPPLSDTALPEGVRDRVRSSRQHILLHPRPLDWVQARNHFERLVDDIAGYHHPRSHKPIHEARLYDLMLSSARFAEQIAELQSKPLIGKILNLRCSHLNRFKDSSDWLLASPVYAWFKKYRVGSAVKYSALLYKAFKKSQPGILFKDFAWILGREAGKRWFLVYLHDKIALEANFIYTNETEKIKAPQ